MQKNIISILLLTLIFLTGCSKASSEVVLRDVSGVEASLEEAANEADSSGSASEEVADSGVSQAEPSLIVVYVCGAVNSPGVYELEATARINDAVAAAGGFNDQADKTYVNLAAALQDGMKLYIPTVQETAAGEEKGQSKSDDNLPTYDVAETVDTDSSDNTGGLININTASKEQLMTLPGIGEKVAGRIIEYREKNGRFNKPEDIMKISGIKEKLFSKISDKITV